jgi:microcompartment protein CcmK/EutM
MNQVLIDVLRRIQQTKQNMLVSFMQMLNGKLLMVKFVDAAGAAPSEDGMVIDVVGGRALFNKSLNQSPQS